MAKVWQFVDSGGIGGIEKHILVLAGALKEKGYDCNIVLWNDYVNNLWLNQIKDAQISYKSLQGSFKHLYKTIKSEHPAIIHTHGYKAGILGRAAGAITNTNTKVVSTFHAGEIGNFPLNLYQFLDNASSILSSRISVSKDIANSLFYSSDLIPNFIEAPAQPPNRPLGKEIAFIGRLSYEKAPDIFCQLAKSYENDGYSWNIYGDGPMGQELRRDFSSNVQFHGMTADLSQVWPKLGLVIIPSRAEGLPLVVLEAMASGIPVIAANVGALPDIISRGVGWVFHSNDFPSLQTVFTEWKHSTPEQLMMKRQKALALVREKYSSAKYVPKIISVYEKAGLPPKPSEHPINLKSNA
ncbi:glycosyltransferase family 4 protein [Flexibacterium corallicola]|uniref:glycosyltransferase family 4 protein n=1 Tax=Flexibacterium corallicola TaxID=3037259 RepID=UPI00286F348C|nr:glycosyltransferase family 4 protein [Pseudovibrio sp. M1P-2-3]